MKHKRILSVFIMILFVFGLFSAFSFSVNAAGIISSTNKYTYIRMAPYWTAEVVDELTSGYRITVIERDYSYFYIEYDKGGITKRGYLPLADSNVTGYSWCNHGIFLPGHNNTTAAVTVRYKPNSDSSSCGTIDADEGEVSSKPLLVLREEDNFYFVQYITNTTATGSTQPLYKRGWVPKSNITIDTVPAAPIPNSSITSRYVLIFNSNNKYLTAVADSTQTSGYALKMASATGDNNQQWKIEKLTYNSNSIYYRIVSAAYNVCVTVTDGTALVGNKFILSTPSTSPNKGQEFALADINKTMGFGYGVNIETRCSGNALTAETSSDSLFQYRVVDNLSSQEFYVDPIDNYWNGFYVYGANKPKYFANSNALLGNINLSLVDSSIRKWNGIANVNLSRSSSAGTAHMQIYGGDIGDYAGLTVPVIDDYGHEASSTNGAHFNQSWYGVNVYLNTLNSSNRVQYNSTTLIGMIITHEFGHALKIKHPHGENAQYVKSIMNQSLSTTNQLTPVSPSEYDKRTLILKWGG